VITGNSLVLFNPRSANSKHRLPNSILQVGASIEGIVPYELIDGNLEIEPLEVLKKLFDSGEYRYFGCTVMPGQQLEQAIPFTKYIKENYPEVIVIWGGYFAANQYRVSLDSGWVAYVIDAQGDIAFPELIRALESGDLETISQIKNVIHKKNTEIVKNPKAKLPDLDKLPRYPYQKLGERYSLKNYVAKTFLGSRTISYHSSFGCPFTCSFCAVVPLYNARWKGKSAEGIMKDIDWFKAEYDINAIEFHDNNFFTARKRTVDFAKRMVGKDISWWGEGRIDTINKYSDDDLKIMRESGLKMIFLGAETGNDDVLSQMDKGGTQSAAQIREFAARMGEFDIIPEYSFVLGMPGDSEEKVMEQIENDIAFIREIKQINPRTEIIIYVYSPVPTEGSELYEIITSKGFRFPEHLEDWLSPDWEKFDLRKNPLTPWLTAEMIDKIKNFETVLNGYYPTASDFRIQGVKKSIMQKVASVRYKNEWYKYPYEIKAMHKYWRYRQPEITGFYSE
jgi:radical SAM superfamily enzyme YgiQ (UPF0313 family)